LIDHGGTAHLRDRNCPVCDSHDGSHVAYPARIDEEKLGAFAFASRKFPEFMHLRLLKCPTCEVLYASPALAPEFLANVYREAGYEAMKKQSMPPQPTPGSSTQTFARSEIAK